MNTIARHVRLDTLHARIRTLRTVLDTCERAAGELLDGEQAAIEASHRVGEVRAELDHAKDEYILEAEALRTRVCPIHGDSLYASCGDCMALVRVGRAA